MMNMIQSHIVMSEGMSANLSDLPLLQQRIFLGCPAMRLFQEAERQDRVANFDVVHVVTDCDDLTDEIFANDVGEFWLGRLEVNDPDIDGGSGSPLHANQDLVASRLQGRLTERNDWASSERLADGFVSIWDRGHCESEIEVVVSTW